MGLASGNLLMKAANRRFVLDASIALAWCFDDEATRFTDRVLDLVADADEVLVPALWPFEVVHVLLAAERKNRITVAQTTAFLKRLSVFPIRVDPPQIPRVFEGVFSVMRPTNLTIHDAAYLELALRTDLPFATFDSKLQRAAAQVGVVLIS